MPAVAVLPALAAAVALVLLNRAAPEYLFQQGFPLDDAWIHAVYARELARSGSLAYNPGIPATGETAPLWAAVLAPIHGLSRDPAAAVAGTKLLGLALHVASVYLLAVAVVRRNEKGEAAVWFGAAAAALHPDLMAASVSGMEIPLAACAIAACAWTIRRESLPLVAAAAGVATLSRPEVAAISAAFPLFLLARKRPRTGLKLSCAAAVGALAATAALGIRNYAVSGRLLPATFHAKVSESPLDLTWQRAGFHDLLAAMPLTDTPYLLIAVACASVAFAIRRTTPDAVRAAAALSLSGLLFCVISFALVQPVDPYAFYHQRYVLPAVFLLVACLPPIAFGLIDSMPKQTVRIGAAAGSLGVVLILLQGSPRRYERLANDARNIDDVQVAFGRALGTARPEDYAWVVDAGAARFFGNAFVVDLIGLNSPEILGPDAQTYLDAQRPTYLDLFPGWSSIQSESPLPRRSFETSTAYTVTSAPAMRQHVLVSCEPPGVRGSIRVRRRTFTFECAR